MVIKEIDNRELWENFLLGCYEKTFLQSWDWGEFNKQMGYKIWRFGVYEGEKIIAVVLVLKISARRGTFLFVPHGPVFMDDNSGFDKKETLSVILLRLKDVAKEEGASFIRFSPIITRSKENQNVFADLGFRQAPIHMHPEVTWELGLTLPEEKLLMNMRKTTRYLIRQAEKNADIEIIRSENIEDLKLFWPVYKETAKRHHFVVFSEQYLQKQLGIFLKNKEAVIFLGKHKGEVVSAAIFIFWQENCFYHHSGSLSKFNKIPVSYLLQWKAIQEAKIRGCHNYNFWGIAPDINTEEDAQKSKHPWAGLSLFKMGFGGAKKEYVKTQDFIISNKYWLNYIIEFIRKRKRSL